MHKVLPQVARVVRRVACAASVAAVLGHAAPVEARTVREEPYPYDTAWNATVRLIRVDLGFTINERDQEVGYLTFGYREGARVVPGSVEIVRTQLDGRAGARIIVQIPQMPAYVEAMILTRLTRKLHTEFGEPVPPARRAPPAPAPGPPDNSPTPTVPAQPPVGDAPAPGAPSERPIEHPGPAETERPREGR